MQISKNDKFSQLIATAREAMAKKDWVTLERVARDMLRQQPDSVDANYVSGTVHRVQKRNKQAIEAFERAL